MSLANRMPQSLWRACFASRAASGPPRPPRGLKFGGEGCPFAFNLVWAILVAPVDNILKPMLLSRGVDVPTPVIFGGAIGWLSQFRDYRPISGRRLLGAGLQAIPHLAKQEDSTADTATA